MLKTTNEEFQSIKVWFEEYDFLSFARKFGDKYGKKLMDTATKTGINAAIDKTSVGKTKSKEKRYLCSPRKKTANY